VTDAQQSDPSGAPTRGEAGGKPSWLSADGRVAALTAGLAAATVLVQLTVLSRLPVPAAHHWTMLSNLLALGLITVMSAATEGFAVHVRVRRGAHSVSLSEIPLVIGLMLTGPPALLIARVGGGAAGLLFSRRQRGIKLAFNVSLLGIQATTGSTVYTLLAGSAEPPGPRQWLAAYAAMIGAEIVMSTALTAAIALHDDPGEWRRLPATVVSGVPLVVVTTSIALSGVLVVQLDPRAVAILGVVCFVTFLGYRGYVRQTQGNAQVEGLYAFTRALDGSLSRNEVTRALLDEVRDQLRAEVATLLTPDPDGYRWTLTRMSGTGAIETTTVGCPPDGGPDSPWWWAATFGQPVLIQAGDPAKARPGAPRDGVAVPVAAGSAGTAVLLVSDSLPEIPTFGPDQVRLFQALANHASLSLAKAVLLDRLQTEVADKQHLALHDPLTGLPNRRQFQQLLADHLAAPGAGVTAVMLLDLDRFKEVNDALGHNTGDALLRQVADRLRHHLDDRGVIARLGGDEFAVMLAGVASVDAALAVGDELTAAMEHPIGIGHLNLTTRVSLGIACGPDHGNEPETLIQRADVAMYAAKRTRSGARVYQPQDDKNSARRLALVADLTAAIDRRELTVEFQPKLDPTSGLVTGAEALARWHHREQGFIPPDVFIPLAEHSGLIRALTLHVLEVALRRCAAWRRAGHQLHVAVNLSPNALLDSSLPDVVTRLLGQTGVPAAALILEITESTIMADPTGSMATLDRLHGIGVKLAIDDFGTGYSSLGRLRELPIHEVKIDKSFVQRIAVDHRDRAVVRSAIQLGHALDLEVVAEGVEDAETLRHLQREGCDLVQGFFISRPLAADVFETWLAGRTGAEPEQNVLYPRFGS
jgi:diguanylate cyclase (GGDEF)-like protein